MHKTNKYIWAVMAGLLVGMNVNAKVLEGSVATVNGRPVLASEYNAYLQGVLDQYQATMPQALTQPHATDILGKEVLQELINKELLFQAAEEAKVQVKDSEIDAGINEIKSRFIIDEKTGKEDRAGADKRFNEALKKQNMTLKRYKEKIKKEVAVRKLMTDQISKSVKQVQEADVKALYDNVQAVLKNDTKKIKALEKQDPAKLEEAQAIAAKLKQLTAEQVRIGHIYLAVTKDMKPADVKKKEELAKQIKKEIDNGLDFSAAAQKYTEDKVALTSGTDMILIKGVAPKEIDEKAFTLAVGKVSAPIKTDIGFHIIKVKEKRAERTVEFNDIAQQLAQYIAQQRVQQAIGDYVQGLRDKADIKITKTFDMDKEAPKTQDKKEEVKK